MSRKDILRGAVTSEPAFERPARAKVRPMLGAAPLPHESNAANRLTSQVGNAFAESKAKFERAEEIERRLSAGHTVIELDADAIDPSFVQDRMDGDISGLKASISEQGQQVPVLVRPHPEKLGRYQVAFGHRRVRALSELGFKVQAVVRELTDEQLVIAQGQENNEREDLSFIEKARFAARLKERFARDVIMSSMSIDKAALSKMLSIMDGLPLELIDAIGPAPGVGLRSWQELVELVDRVPAPGDAGQLAGSDEMQALSSPERFKAVIARLKPRRVIRGATDVMSSRDGERLAQVKQTKTKVDISIDKKATPEFAAFVLDRLPALFEEHQLRIQREKEA